FTSSNTAFALGACDLARLGGFLAARRCEKLGSNPARPATAKLDMIPIALRSGYQNRMAGLEHCDSLLAEIRSSPHRNAVATNSGKPADGRSVSSRSLLRLRLALPGNKGARSDVIRADPARLVSTKPHLIPHSAPPLDADRSAIVE